MRRSALAAFLVLGLTGPAPLSAGIVNWGQWDSNTSVSAVGSIPGLGVTMTYTGDITGYTETGGSGISYWTPASTYTSPQVSNLPPRPDILMLIGNATNPTYAVTFSRPVVDPIMNIATLGNNSEPAEWQFAAPFTILSSGPGLLAGGSLTQLPNNVLHGVEGNGTIRFSGTYSAITWTVPMPEYFSGFTIGAVAVPEPSALSLVGCAAVGLAGRHFRRRRMTPVPGRVAP